nr:unnamed protein product [Callosobruchus analis]
MAVMLDPKDKGDKGIIKDVMDKFSEIRELIEEGCTEGTVEYVINETRTSRTKEGEMASKCTYILPLTIDEEGVNDMRHTYNILTALRDILKERGSRRFTLVTPIGLGKFMEFVMNRGGINTQRRRGSHDAEFAIAAEKDIDIIIALEPNKNLVSNSNWCTDKRTDVAIFFRTKQCRVKNLVAKDGYLVVHTSSFCIYCCYSSPNILQDFKRYLDDLVVDAKSVGGEYIILDKRGLYLSDWRAESELVVHNTGNKPTFSRGLTQSCIDVTISTSNLAKDIAKWEVLDEESLSDHHFIYLEVGKKKKWSKNSWEIRPEINWEEFRILTEWKAKIHHDCDSETFTAIIQESYKE